MKIIRDGMEFELTEDEMRSASREVIHIDDVREITSMFEDMTDYDKFDVNAILNNEALLDKIAITYRDNVDWDWDRGSGDYMWECLRDATECELKKQGD